MTVFGNIANFPDTFTKRLSAGRKPPYRRNRPVPVLPIPSGGCSITIENYSMALTCLKHSAQKLSGRAEVLIHLGMTQYRLSDIDAAKQALNTGLKNGGAEFKHAPQAAQAHSKMAKMPAAEHK